MNHSEIFNHFGLIIENILSRQRIPSAGPVLGALVLTEGLFAANITKASGSSRPPRAAVEAPTLYPLSHLYY